MRFSAILLPLIAVIWLVLCLYLALPQLIGLNFTGHIVLGGLVASLPATTAFLGFVMIFFMLVRKLDSIDKKLDELLARQTAELRQPDSGLRKTEAGEPPHTE